MFFDGVRLAFFHVNLVLAHFFHQAAEIIVIENIKRLNYLNMQQPDQAADKIMQSGYSVK